MAENSDISNSISRAGDRACESRAPGGIRLDELRRDHQRFIEAVDRRAVAVFGVDFSSAPRRAKPIVIAAGQLDLQSGRLRLDDLLRLDSLTDFEAWLSALPPGVIGFDLPFGLPRELVHSLGWPEQYEACIQTYTGHSRDELRAKFKSFCAARPTGRKFAHRETDRPAGSSPSMKWVNPPVAWMLHARVPRMLAAALTLPGQVRADPARIALEAYPGLLARSVSSASYTSDTRAKQTPGRTLVRGRIIDALVAGELRPAMPVELAAGQRHLLLDDASGDSLDAVLCLLQAGWGVCRPQADFGLMPGIDPLEGWIVGAGIT